MAIIGTTFDNAMPNAPHIRFSVGASGNVFADDFTAGWLISPYSGGCGYFTAEASGVDVYAANISGGTPLLAYATNDFSSGFALGGAHDVWQWIVATKAAGAAHYRWHSAYHNGTALVWSHGESVGSANHADFGAMDHYRIGSGNATSIQAFTSVGTTALYDVDLSGNGSTDAAIEARFTTHAYDLLHTNLKAGWLLKQADIASSIVDFTGGGANETGRINVTSAADPTWYDYSLTPPASGNPAGGRFLPFFGR